LLPGRGECHLWVMTWAGVPAVGDYALSLLSDPERARAERIRDKGTRAVFTASRAAQRMLGAAYLGYQPSRVRIDRTCRHCGDPAHGRPRIAGEAQLDFSVTHCGRLLLVAFVGHGRVGVDAETAGRQFGGRRGAGRLADFALTAAEAELVKAEPQCSRSAVFCRLWTRKEAVVKLTGHGIFAPLRSIETATGTGTVSLRGRARDGAADTAWLTDLPADVAPADPAAQLLSGYVGALATTSPLRTIVIRELKPNLRPQDRAGG
jgi:4'-phosphopantetheinyl transferase